MKNKLKNTGGIALILGLLTGCSENGFLFRSGSDYDDQPDSQAVYYIGEPYYIKGVLYTPKEDMRYSEKGFAAIYTRDTQNRLTTNGELFDDNALTAAHKTLPLPSLVRITNLENGNTAIVRINDRGPVVNSRLIDVSRQTAEALEMSETGTTMVQVDILPLQSRQLKAQLKELSIPRQIQPESPIPSGDSRPIYIPDGGYQPPVYNGSVQINDLPDNDVIELTPNTQADKSALVGVSGWYVQAGVFSQEANLNRTMQTLGKIAPISSQPKGNGRAVVLGPFASKQEASFILDKVRQTGYADAWLKYKK